jgi:hypothetical protein
VTHQYRPVVIVYDRVQALRQWYLLHGAAVSVFSHAGHFD